MSLKLLLGNFENAAEARKTSFYLEALGTLGGARKIICISAPVSRFANVLLNRLNLTASHPHSGSELKTAVQDADAFVVSGSSPHLLLLHLQQAGIVEEIRRKVFLQGAGYVGLHAGAEIAGAGIAADE